MRRTLASALCISILNGPWREDVEIDLLDATQGIDPLLDVAVVEVAEGERLDRDEVDREFLAKNSDS